MSPDRKSIKVPQDTYDRLDATIPSETMAKWEKIERALHAYQCLKHEEFGDEGPDTTVVSCEECGADVQIKRWKQENFVRHFCSHPCLADWQSEHADEFPSPE